MGGIAGLVMDQEPASGAEPRTRLVILPQEVLQMQELLRIEMVIRVIAELEND